MCQLNLSPFARIMRRIFIICLCLFCCARLSSAFSTVSALSLGKTSSIWDPSLTTIGIFGANHSEDSVFIAADWGIAAQIECFSSAKPGLVHELFWDYKGSLQLAEIINSIGKQNLYIAAIIPPTTWVGDSTKRIFSDIEQMPGWREVPAEAEIRNLKAVQIRKWIRQ